ncbi:hypothetical protein EYC80_000641 [Monilinia laxa]|uniref:Uncharacterized protein n=1 Tax=Monilinia laxa TaxID=61186 RepID=A0A5N6KBG6_MONLA|nr:hypothetical protein EYC80_000641 [Monilinia laxa]
MSSPQNRDRELKRASQLLTTLSPFTAGTRATSSDNATAPRVKVTITYGEQNHKHPGGASFPQLKAQQILIHSPRTTSSNSPSRITNPAIRDANAATASSSSATVAVPIRYSAVESHTSPSK